jgi:hypothetical protein
VTAAPRAASTARGSTGAEVEYAQQRLNVQGARPPLAIDGIFGPLTRKAASESQNNHALVPDAVIGSKTWASLDGPVVVGEDVGSGPAGGGGGPGAKTLMYDTSNARVTPPAPGTKKADVQKQVDARQKAGDLGKTIKADDHGDDPLGAHLLNVIVGLGNQKQWGSELDLLTIIGYAPKTGGDRPVGKVTLRIDGAGNADATLIGSGKLAPVPGFATVEAAKTALKATFGFNAVVERDATWTPDQLNKVNVALGKLASSERAALAGVDLVRVAALADKDGKPLTGQFSFKHGVVTGATAATHEQELRIASLAFDGDDVKFIGDGSNAAPASFETILHEAGHAIETADQRKAQAAVMDDIAADNAAVAKVNQANSDQVAAMTAALAAFTRQLRNSDGVSGAASGCARIEKRAIGVSRRCEA